MAITSRLRRGNRWYAALLLTWGCTWQIGTAQIPKSADFKHPTGITASRDVDQPRSTHYTKKKTFHLPVKFDPRSRMRIREVHLFIKTEKSDWIRKETGTSATNKFTYTAVQDGTYWFCVTTVDDQGRTLPPSIGKSLKIVVDSTPPTISVKPWTSPQGKGYVKCTVQDANPDYTSLRVSYVDQLNNMHALSPNLQQPSSYLLPPSGSWSGRLHVRCSDKARNELSTYVSVAVPQPKPPTPPLPLPVAKSPKVKPKSPPVLPPEQIGSLPSVPKQTPKPIIPVVSKKPVASPPVLKPFAKHHAPSTNLLNTTKAEIEYRIDQVGPSGVGVVDIYVTSNNGETWQFLEKDTDTRTPAEVQLPGEGVFGIRVIITNGNGFGGTPPRPGDRPDFNIEVDTTRPQVQLADVNPYANGGKLTIRWTANDRNLSATPVKLYYRTASSGSWQLIAQNVKNLGAYSWEFPRKTGGRFYLRMDVADLAGNVASVETPNPVVLDMTEPRAQVVGVRPASPSPVVPAHFPAMPPK